MRTARLPIVVFSLVFGLVISASAAADGPVVRLVSPDSLERTGRWLAAGGPAGVWAVYRDASSGIRIISSGEKDAGAVGLQGAGAPSGLALTVDGETAYVGTRTKQPTKALLVASTADLEHPASVGGDTEPLARLQLHADGASLRALWYGEQQEAEDADKYHLYYRESGNGGTDWSPVQKLLPGIYPVWVNDPAGDVAVFSWISDADGNRIQARIKPAGADRFAPEIKIADVAPVTPIFDAFLSGSRWFVYWVAQYGQERKGFLLEGAWSDDKGRSWSRFSFPTLKGLDINTVVPATDGRHIALGVSGSYRFQDQQAKNDVFLLRSFDNGDSWEEPLRPRPETAVYSHAWYLQPAFGKAGELMLVWDDWRDIRRSIRFSYSGDGGRSWSVADRRIPLDRQLGWGVNPYGKAVFFQDDRVTIAGERFTGDDMRRKELLWVELDTGKFPEIDRSEAADTAIPDTDELKARVQAYWKAMQEEDYETAYAMYDPFFRARIPFHSFRGTMGRIRYIDVELKAVQAQGAVAEAATRITAEVPEYRVPSGAKVKSSRRVVDLNWRWLLVDGEWYREFSSEVLDKRYAAY